MSDFLPIHDIATWFREESDGFFAAPNFRSRGLTADQQATVERYQLGGFSNQLAELRAGGRSDDDLRRLESFVSGFADASGMKVYRGILLGRGYQQEDDFQLEEPSINSWTFYPSIALRSALAQGDGVFMVIRDRISEAEPSFYVDEWEFEVLRLSLSKMVRVIAKGPVNFLGRTVTIYVAEP